MLSAFASVTIGPAMPTVTPLKSGAVCGRTGATRVAEPRGVPWQAAEAGGENAKFSDANGSDSSSFPCIAAGERTDVPQRRTQKRIRVVDRSSQEDTTTTPFQRSPMRFSAGERQKCALRTASPKTIARIISIDWACPGALRIP